MAIACVAAKSLSARLKVAVAVAQVWSVMVTRYVVAALAPVGVPLMARLLEAMLRPEVSTPEKD